MGNFAEKCFPSQIKTSYLQELWCSCISTEFMNHLSFFSSVQKFSRKVMNFHKLVKIGHFLWFYKKRVAVYGVKTTITG